MFFQTTITPKFFIHTLSSVRPNLSPTFVRRQRAATLSRRELQQIVAEMID